MIEQPAFAVEDRSIPRDQKAIYQLAQTESIFALSNGHIGLRGNLMRENHTASQVPIEFCLRDAPHALCGDGVWHPESAQCVINVTNGKIIRLLVDDEPFDIRYGELHQHERELDLRNGVLRRSARWTSPAGRTIRIASVRLVSLTQRSIVGINLPG